MAIRFVLPEQESESVAFAYSPVVEAVLSLHVLVAPRHHPLQHAWVRRMRRLDPRLKAEVKAFRFAYAGHFPDFLFPRPDEEFLEFEDELAFLHDLEPETLAFEFMRPVYDHTGTWPRDRSLLESEEVRRDVLERCARYGPESEALGRLVFDDPSELGRRFCSLLERYWEEAFEEEWASVEPLLVEAVEEAGGRLATAGVLDLLADLRPQLRVEPEQRAAWIKIPHEHEVELSPLDPLVLSPSYFVWPHLRVNCDPPFPVSLIYPPRSVREQVAPKLPSGELVEGLRALGDDTRLRVIALIAERPRSTQELAPLVGMSEAGLSKHLRLLARAGVLESRREGYYVLYSLAPERLESLSASLLAFIRRGG